MRIIRALIVAMAALWLGGCDWKTFGDHSGSIAGGECKVFEHPPYVVKGKTQYDQDWADSTIEGGVGACHWPRPAARPPELDAPAVRKPVAAAKKKPGLIKRIRARLSHKAAPAPPPPVIAPEPPQEEPAEQPEEPPPPRVVQPPPAPRSAIDRLLHPNGD